MRFRTVYMAYITYLIVQICFQNFMPLKRIVFQRQGKVFLKKHKNLAVFPHICLKASTFTDKRQKSGKKTFLLFRSNIGIHDFVKIRRMFTNFFYFFLNLDTSMHKHKIKVYQSHFLLQIAVIVYFFVFTRKIYNVYNSTGRTLFSICFH